MNNFGVIFDSDGVIVNSEPHSLVAFVQALEEQGIKPNNEDVKNSYGLTDALIINYLKSKYVKELNLAKFSRHSKELYIQRVKEKGLQVFPGVRELLTQLNQQNIPYILASSGSVEKIKFNLTHTGLLAYFPLILSGEEIEKSKPEPDIFLVAAQKINIPPSQCVVIEDSINGVVAAQRAGMKCLAITNTFSTEELKKAGAHLVLSEMSQVNVPILRKLLYPE